MVHQPPAGGMQLKRQNNSSSMELNLSFIKKIINSFIMTETSEETEEDIIPRHHNILPFDYQETSFYYESTNGPKTVHLVTS